MVETIIQKSDKDLIIILPKDIIDTLSLKEGTIVDIEPFVCAGSPGARIKPKND